MTTKTGPHPYGCGPDYVGPPVHQLIKLDVRGTYRRPSIDLATGDLSRDPASGAVLHDESQHSVRHHLSLVGKGFSLIRLVD